MKDLIISDKQVDRQTSFLDDLRELKHEIQDSIFDNNTILYLEKSLKIISRKFDIVLKYEIERNEVIIKIIL